MVLTYKILTLVNLSNVILLQEITRNIKKDNLHFVNII